MHQAVVLTRLHVWEDKNSCERFELENINAHAIRRAYAKNLHNNGASVALISKALGHSDLAVTTQYLDLDVDEVAKDLRDYL